MPDPVRLPLAPLTAPLVTREPPALFAVAGAPGSFVVGVAWGETLCDCGTVTAEALRAFARELLQATAEALGVVRVAELECGK